MIDEILRKVLRIYLKAAIFLFNKFAILKKRWQLRKEIKKIESLGGKVIIKNNEYVGGTDIIIEFPLRGKKSKKHGSF